MDEQQIAPVIEGLEIAAQSMRGGFRALPHATRQRMDVRARRAAFSAFEANRGGLRDSEGWGDTIFYILYLVGTVLSPIFVVLFTNNARTVGWDTVGIVSTTVLIAWTYGLYTLRMAWRFFAGIGSVLYSVLFSGVRIPASANAGAAEQDTDPDARYAFDNLILLILGTVASGFAWSRVFELYHRIADDLAKLNWIYIQFFCWVYALALLFIIMDLYIANNEKSHAESFVASSSMVHATVPMFVGMTIMGSYLLMEYWFARYHGMDSSGSVRTLSIEFVSGALSFQMIVSNILFIFIKQNWLFRAVYVTIDSSIVD